MVTRCLLREAAPAPLLRWCALSKNATSHHSHTESGSISLHALSAPAWRGVRELLEAPGCRVGFYWGKKPEELKQSKTIADAMTLGFPRRRRRRTAWAWNWPG